MQPKSLNDGALRLQNIGRQDASLDEVLWGGGGTAPFRGLKVRRGPSVVLRRRGSGGEAGCGTATLPMRATGERAVALLEAPAAPALHVAFGVPAAGLAGTSERDGAGHGAAVATLRRRPCWAQGPRRNIRVLCRCGRVARCQGPPASALMFAASAGQRARSANDLLQSRAGAVHVTSGMRMAGERSCVPRLCGQGPHGGQGGIGPSKDTHRHPVDGDLEHVAFFDFGGSLLRPHGRTRSSEQSPRSVVCVAVCVAAIQGAIFATLQRATEDALFS